SARCAKSADRIEAESTPIAAIVPARSGPLTEGGDEHAVGTMPMRPQPHPRSTPVRPIDPHGFQLGPMFDQRVAGGVRLGAREGADRVDEQAAGTQSVGGAAQAGALSS